MHVQTVLVDTSWLHNLWEMFLLFIKFNFLWKNSVSEKIKAHFSTPKYYNNFSAAIFLILFKKFLAPPPFKQEGGDYPFYLRDYKGETIK